MSKLNKFKLGITVIFLLVFGLILGSTREAVASGNQTLKPLSGGKLIVAIPADVVTMDPHNTGDIPSMILQKHIYEGLVQWGNDGKIAPSLATNWVWEDRGKTLTIHLKNGVLFHDGTVLDSLVVKYNLERILDPGNSLRARTFLKDITSVDAPDKNTVVVRFQEPNGEFLAALAAPTAFIISKSAIEKHGKNLSLNAVGTGPFKLIRWDTQQEISLEAFSQYHAGRPYLDGINFRPVPDQQARAAMLEAGDVHAAYPIAIEDINRFVKSERFVFKAMDSMDNLHMHLNELYGPLGDANVRRALNYAIDKTAIVDHIYLGNARPLTDSPITPIVWGYSPAGDFYKYDVAKAKELLSKAGYPGGFKMTIWSPEGRYLQDRRVAEAVQGYLRDIGIDAKLEIYEFATFVKMLFSSRPETPPKYGAVLLTIAPSSRDAGRGLGYWRSEEWLPKGLNAAFHSDKRVDELMKRGRQTVDEKERLKTYAEVQKLIMEEAPAIFLVSLKILVAHHKNIQGLIVDPLGGVVANYAWIAK